MIVMTTAIEFSMTIWSSDVLNHHDGLSKGTAATGVTAIVTGMTVGRLIIRPADLAVHHDRTSVVRVRLDDRRVRRLLGIDESRIGIHRAVHRRPWHFAAISARDHASGGILRGRPDLATAYAALGGGFAIAVAPFGLGALADHIGSHTAMTVVPVFVLLAAAGVATTRRPPHAVGAVIAAPLPIAIGDVPV